MRAAAAIFVRTPGLSAAKSRLAAQIGADAAAELYGLALGCACELAAGLKEEGLHVVWAVAEEEGVSHPLWRETGLPAMHSGAGGLGECLHNVYSQLRAEADTVLLLGSDAPQLTVAGLRPAWEQSTSAYAVGPSPDGGFYLFAGREDIDAAVWREVEYSTASTLQQLEQRLAVPLERLEAEPDFDDVASLREVITRMPAHHTAAQEEFCRAAEAALADQRDLDSVSAKNMP